MKLQPRFLVRTAALAIFAALMGFSYSIVSQAGSALPREAFGTRAVGSSTLRFLAPVYPPAPGDYDLGDALYGTVITRYITAAGGLRPYNFTTTGITAGAASTLSVMTAGCVMGSASFATVTPNLAFDVVLTGSTENDVAKDPVPTTTRKFHLTLFPTGAQLFRFASDHLNNGLLGQSYISKVDSIGGKGNVTYSIVAGSVTLNGSQAGTGNSLADTVGLSLSSDGTLYGRPLKTGLVTFKARATDSIKRNAKDRTNAVQDQVYAFNIEDTRITSTDSTMLSLSVKGDTSKLNTDTVKFEAFMNLGGSPVPNLDHQQFAFIYGGNTYQGFTNGKGVVGALRGGALVFPDGTTLKATVDSVNGTIKGMLSHASLSNGLDAVNIVNRSTKRVAVAIVICNLVVASDTLDADARHIGTRYSLQYNIARYGRLLGGTFQVYDVRGSDANDIAGNAGDAWITKFLIAPRVGIDDTAAFTDINNVTVRIGKNFTQTIPASGLKVSSNGSINLAAKGLGAALSKLQINGRSSSGSLTTNPLSINTTGLPRSVDTVSASTNFFNLAIDVNRNAPNATFNGEDAKAIQKVPRLNKWVDRGTKKP